MRHLIIIVIILLSNNLIAQDIDYLEYVNLSKRLSVKPKLESWIPIKGYNKIDEELFYLIAGFPEQAHLISSKKSSVTPLIFGGIALSFGGWLFLASAGTEEANQADGIIGTAGVTLGSILMYIGFDRISKIWTSKQYAEIVAEQYNKKLKKELGLTPSK